MKTQIIIVAGGKGKRMQSEMPKQFLLLKGKPILMHTIEQFLVFSTNIFVVLPKSDILLWEELVKKHQFKSSITVIEGGKERFFSVRNAINNCSDEGMILIHDGVRPLVSEHTVLNVIKELAESQSAVPVLEIYESIRQIEEKKSISVDRSRYKLVQTPQGFPAKLIKKSYNQEFNTKFTDDASVFESAGYKISLVKGNKENIKITTPEDIELAEFYLNKANVVKAI